MSYYQGVFFVFVENIFFRCSILWQATIILNIAESK